MILKEKKLVLKEKYFFFNFNVYNRYTIAKMPQNNSSHSYIFFYFKNINLHILATGGGVAPPPLLDASAKNASVFLCAPFALIE